MSENRNESQSSVDKIIVDPAKSRQDKLKETDKVRCKMATPASRKRTHTADVTPADDKRAREPVIRHLSTTNTTNKAAAPALTAAPTRAPTAAPTRAPTAAPTRAPTAAPTRAPTAAPTRAPTAAPTRAPTAAPTRAPTAAPTRAPTASLTGTPALDPAPGPSPLGSRHAIPTRKFLDDTVVPILLQALEALTHTRPEKPIDFLIEFLTREKHNFVQPGSNAS